MQGAHTHSRDQRGRRCNVAHVGHMQCSILEMVIRDEVKAKPVALAVAQARGAPSPLIHTATGLALVASGPAATTLAMLLLRIQ